MSSRPDWIFEIHQLWQSGFSRVYSNSISSCSFEPEIIKIGQSSHKSNNIVNFQESTTILNVCTRKKSENLLKAPRMLLMFLKLITTIEYIYIYIYMCVCVCVCILMSRSTERFVFFRIYLYMCMFPTCCFPQRTYIAQGLVNGVLNETRTHSCLNDVQLVMVLYRGHSSLFRRVCLP